MNFKNISFLILCFSLFLACSDNNSNKKSADELWESDEAETPLYMRVDALIFEIEKLKQEAKASEDEKVNTTKMLIDEIALTLDKYDAKLYEDIKTYHKEMKRELYDESNMDDEKVVEAYDEATAKMISAINSFVEKTPEFNNYSRSKILYNDIIKADASDFKIRKDYNAYVAEFNMLLEEKEDEIKKLGSKYSDIKKYKLFYGGDLVL